LLLNRFGWRATAQGGGWLASDAAPIPASQVVAFDIYLYYARQDKKYLLKISLN
jgi:hypothetical protein